MKHFKHTDGRVFAFELDGTQDQHITADMRPMTQAEVDAHLAPPPPLVPATVTNAQGKAALILMGKDTAVETIIDNIVDPIERKLAWNDYNNRLTWERSNARLQAIAALADLDLDALFTLAAQQ